MDTPRRAHLNLKALVGSGDRIALLVLPFLLVGLLLDVVFRAQFEVGGPPAWLALAAGVGLAAGIVVWAWSVYLILTRIPRGDLITDGPYAVVKHPLYTSVALLVLPCLGLLLNTWLGVGIGAVMYIATRRCAPAEEADLARTYGPAWERYRDGVKIGWL